MQRYLVIGASGSGKSTLARAIGQRLDLPYIATDPFYWGPGWIVAPPAHLEACLRAALAHPAWVLDGNFDDQRERVWAQAECIVWLDLAWPVTVGRVMARNVRWALTREPVWSGNTMTWRRAWSGVRHAARSHGLKRRLYPGWLAAVQGAMIVRLTEQRSIDDWLHGLSKA